MTLKLMGGDPWRSLRAGEVVGDVLHAKASLGDIQNKLKCVVIPERDSLTVYIQKDCRRQPSQALVAINQRMVGHDRMQESSRLEPDSRIGVLSESTRLRSGNGRIQKPEVSYGAKAETTHQTK